jgi:hypothetical protein
MFSVDVKEDLTCLTDDVPKASVVRWIKHNEQE